MTLSNRRINAILQLVLPYVIGIAIAAVGYFWYISPVFTTYLRSRSDAQALEARLRGVEAVVARGRSAAWPDEAEPLRLFESRVAKDDHVMDVVELLTKALNDSVADGKLRNLAIGTGDEAVATSPSAVRTTLPGDAEVIDPRWSLFPYPLKHTPVTMSFDCSYATIVNFLWRVRDLPTAIEVRSMKLTRGLPLMSVQFTFFVFQRGDSTATASQQPPQPATETPPGPRTQEPAQSPFTPRLLKPGTGRSGG